MLSKPQGTHFCWTLPFDPDDLAPAPDRKKTKENPFNKVL